MLRPLIIAMFVLAMPTFAMAQEHRDEHHPPPGRPAPRPAIVPHGPVVAPRVVVPGPRVLPPGPGGHPALVFRGRPYHPIPFARPFVYPAGWAYRRWVVGAILPPLFLTPDYYYTDYSALGFPPPDPGFQWVQYGPDLLLVNVATGQVVDVAYGVFY
ncbi:MAG: RcnB family protein [Xanthobacteraceae bacterium]